jgi:hypothetical protein
MGFHLTTAGAIHAGLAIAGILTGLDRNRRGDNHRDRGWLPPDRPLSSNCGAKRASRDLAEPA